MCDTLSLHDALPIYDFVGMFEKVLADTAGLAVDTYEFWGVRE
jgi:hypothetical protein